jgi:hypothetical protein
MAQLEPYTSTYTDVDASVMDADDLVAEFYRVAEFLALWAGSIDAIGQEDHFEEFINIVTGQLAEVLPANGLIQRLMVDASVEEFTIQIGQHETGDPFRVFISIRCASPDTVFRLSVPTLQTHVFGVLREQFEFFTLSEPYQPSAIIGDGYYGAMVICTYGSEAGVMVQVFAHNPEVTEVTFNDVLTAVPL